MGVLAAQKMSGAPRYVQVSCRSKDEGKAVMGAISACKPNWSYHKTDSVISDVLNWGWLPGGSQVTGDWKTFRVRTGSSSESNTLIADIGKCIDEYGDYAGGTDEVFADDDDSSGGGGVSKTAVYLIIGAALAVVLAIVLTRRRK